MAPAGSVYLRDVSTSLNMSMLFGGAPCLAGGPRGVARAEGGHGQGAGRVRELLPGQLGGAVQVDRIKSRVESAPGVCNQRLKLKCDEPLSIVAFNFNLRRYNWDETHPAQFNISSQFTGTSFETKNSR